jgi:hypothetical protein
MDEHTFKNWQKIKETLEASGKTDTTFYRRALSILSTKKDPLESFLSYNESK